MKISKRQLKRIIKEAIIYTQPTMYGGLSVTDEAGEYLSIGEMVAALIDAGDTDIFNGPQGVDTVSLDRMMQQDGGGVQGGMERWDSDVFPEYYNVDLSRVVRLWARLKNHTIEELEMETDEW